MRKKKIFKSLLACSIALALIAVIKVPSYAYDYMEKDGWTYYDTDFVYVHSEGIHLDYDACVISGYSSSNESVAEITIPDELDGKKVVMVCSLSNLKANKVVMGTNVILTSDGAFSNNTYLQTIDTMNTIYVHTASFYNCTNLKTACLSKVKNLGSMIFSGCTNLETVDLSALSEIPYSNIFDGCQNLKTLIMPQVQTIAANSDGTLAIPDSVTTVCMSDTAFAQYKDALPAGVKNHNYNSGVITKKPTTTATGVKTYTCSLCGSTRTESVPKLTAVKITASNITKTCSTKSQSFQVSAKSSAGTALTYTSNNKYITVNKKTGKVTIKAKYIGSATITISSAATSKYAAATKKITVTVKPAKTTLSSAVNVTGKKMTVRWKKNTLVKGYQIQYSTSSKFASGNKTVTIGKNSTVSTTIAKLTKGKTYYVHIRTYKKVSGKTYCSAWSTVKKVKITK